MSTLTNREEAFLSTVNEWMNEGNNEVYLAGSTRGPIHLDEEQQRFEIREDQALSERLIDALIESGVHDVRVTGEQTLDLLNEMASERFVVALQQAANDSSLCDADGDDHDFMPGMH